MWTFLVIKNGHKKKYEVEDIPLPLPEDSSEKLGNVLEEAWLEEREKSKIRSKEASLVKTIIRVFWKEFVQIIFLHSFNEFLISISQQVFLGYFLIYLKETKQDATIFYHLEMTGVALVLSHALNHLLSEHFLSQSSLLGCKIKIALSSLIFRKCLRLGNNAEGDASVGRIINLMSSDLAKFDNVIMFCHFAYSAIISTLIISFLLASKASVFISIVCLVVILLSTPAQILISKIMANFREQMAKASDERIRFMDEIICGIHIIKMYAWEKPFENILMSKRGVEMNLIRKALNLKGIRMTLNLMLSKFSLYVIIVAYCLSGGKVVPEVIFVVLGYCSILARVMNGMFFRSFGEFAECTVSMKRIQNFLELSEFTKLNTELGKDDCNAVKFHNVRCKWNPALKQDTLKNITFDIKSKKLTFIIGQVGSGKTALLNAILGELPINEGSLKINGCTSYYSQVPWIFAGSIRKNIIFCEEYDAERYNRVINVCALKHDLTLFPDADLTLIGERGISLSGGQKARIALARAVYKQADIYLLDDPLSAIDSIVSKQIFHQCILNFLEDKTCILVSHQLQLLTRSDYIVYLHEGGIKYQGTFLHLQESDFMYTDMLKKSNLNEDNCEIGPNDENVHSNEPVIDPSEDKAEKSKTVNANGVSSSKKSSVEEELEKEDNEMTNPYAFVKFLRLGAGTSGLMLMSCLFFLSQCIISSCDIWLAYWTSSTETETLSSTKDTLEIDEKDTKKWYFFSFEMSMNGYFIAGYSAILFGIFTAALLRNFTFTFFAQKCSKKLHDAAFHSILYTNLSFFHKNPSGRILNRFSKDMSAVDDVLLPYLLDAVFSMLQIFTSFAVSASINIVYSIPATVVFILLFVVRNYYLRVSVDLVRLEGITKSPVFVHVHTTLQGLPVIRACSVANEMIRVFDQHQDIYSSAWYLYKMATFGYTYCLKVICLLYLTIIVIGSFFLDLTGSQIGLAMIQLTGVLNYIQLAMKLSADVSNRIVSVDRLLRYSTLESEKQPKDDSVPNDWPSKGSITFDNVSFQHNISLQPSIRNISFVIGSGEKIGIVGRTGAGKSSLLAALFRLGSVDGSISIDGVNTSSIRLEKLRSKISVIPQDPILFSGTLRKNLDPPEEYNDDVLWKAIEDAQLKNMTTEGDGNGLDMLITEGGRNLSLGQRQLICLARAIIRDNKILILDEATASVDQLTDEIIQKIIRNELKSRTILIIAHRLNTVSDCDKILVMDDGIIVEYGHPYQLLHNRDGFFYKLVSETGESLAATFTGTVRENYTVCNDQEADSV